MQAAEKKESVDRKPTIKYGDQVRTVLLLYYVRHNIVLDNQPSQHL